METTPIDIVDQFKIAVDVLYRAQQDGVQIILNKDQLQLKLPEHANINPGLLQQIKDNKQLIIDYLGNSSWRSKAVREDVNEVKKVDRNAMPELPLSFSQERIWFIDQLEGSVQYNSVEVLRIKGNIDVDALQSALQTIVNRHEVLRTVVRQGKSGVYQHIKEENGFTLNVVDGSEFETKPKELKQFINTLLKAPFNLSEDDMIRVHLVKLSEKEHLMVTIIHHIASDGWSWSILVNELSELYKAYISGRPANLLPLKLQFSDYAVWQRQYIQGELLNRKIAYWREKLEGVSPLQLPTDYPRPAVLTTRGTSISFPIQKELSDDLKKLSKQHGATLFMTLLSVFKVLLYRYSGQQDICVGTSIADRTHEVEDLIGFFVNTLALRSEVKGDASFLSLLQDVRTTTMQAYEHQEAPFEKIVEAVAKERDTSRHPLFQVMLVLGNTTKVPQLQLGDALSSREETPHHTSKFDLTFFLNETELGLDLTVAYSTELFGAATIQRMISHFRELLSSAIKDPLQSVSRLGMLSAEEKQQLLEEFNSSTVDYPRDKSIVDLFEEQAHKNPDATAVVFDDVKLSYRELNERANQLAHHLRSRGIVEEDLVPLCIERSAEMIVGIMGILKAGAAYVPIDPEFPVERIRYMIEDSGATVIVTSSEMEPRLLLKNLHPVVLDDARSPIINEGVENLDFRVKPNGLAYVIYTSGSTGKPKGVMIEHKSLVDYVFGLKQSVEIDKCRSFALVSSIATDLGNTVLYSSLVFGGALHVFSKNVINDGDKLLDYFASHSIDCLKIVPSHWKALSVHEELLPAKLLVFGGEALPSAIAKDIISSGSSCRVVNHYGPTETTIGKLLHRVGFSLDYNVTIPIGKPFSNTRVFILSKDLELCPVGVPGELYITGDGLARGYTNQAELTASKFVPDTLSTTGGSVLYRTGDLVKYLPDGNIEFIGRIDEQVKIHGYRIELGEIENVLQQSGLVKQSVVIAKEDKTGNKRLVAYVLADGFDQAAMMSYLGRELPEYMKPAVWIELESFPLLENGKINRKALPDPNNIEARNDVYVAPVSGMESALAEIWQELLEVDQVSTRDNFFELGGHSLLAIQLISIIRKRLEIEVGIGDIFDYPTIESLIARFAQKADTSLLPAIKPGQRPEHIPLSFSQERLWFIHQLEGSIQYHRPEVLRLKGKLDEKALVFALKMIVNRHEVLRTVIVTKEEGEPYQYIKEKDNWELQQVDGSHFQHDAPALQAYIDSLINQPFDLATDDMIRGHLIKLSGQEHILVVTMHHIASDGWSISIFVKEVTALYKSYIDGHAAPIELLPVQYADYALWQRQYLQGEVLDKKIRYWKDKLEGVAPLQLPYDYPRPPVQSTKGAMTSFMLDRELTDRLQQLSHDQNTTLYMTLLSVFKVLLYRYSGQEDICVGTPIAGRQQQEVEHLIGFFVNTLALRSEVKGSMSFTELLQQVRATTLEAYEHGEAPFEKIVEAVVKERDLSRNPLFQVLFDLGTANNSTIIRLNELEICPEQYIHATSKFDLTFSIAQIDAGLKVFIEYGTDLYNPETIGRMKDHFHQLLIAVVSNPRETVGKLRLLTEEEKEQLTVGFNDTAAPIGDKTVVRLFEEQVLKTPDGLALVFAGEQLTYDELNKRANSLANYLRNKGLSDETLVPVCFERSSNMIVAILGILKAGYAYVPIDPGFPADRVKYLLADTAATIVVTDKHNRSKLQTAGAAEVLELEDEKIRNEANHNLDLNISLNGLAYVIYTSGSTGTPKGVLIEHRNLINYLVNTKTRYTSEAQPGSGTYMLLSYTFDASVTGIFLPLITGKSLIIGSSDFPDIFEDENFLRYAPYDFIKATPSHLEFLQSKLSEVFGKDHPGKLVVGGEALLLTQFDYLQQQGTDIEVVNEYGPTEATVGCSTFSFHPSGYFSASGNNIPIGKPIDNVQLYILDAHAQVVPVGVIGELYIGGAGVARGYLNQLQLSAEKFINDPFRDSGAKMYKTGDLARWMPDGNIEYIGRVDDQVKVRGYRVELGEIESAVQESGLVKAVSVLALEDGTGSKRLVGYVVPGEGFSKDAIDTFLKGKLPVYMVPSYWHKMDQLPLTVNGKVDRKALPDPGRDMLAHKEYIAPQTEVEMTLATIWQDLLRLEKVGIHDHFFEIGGHSLLAMRLIATISKKMNIDLGIRTLFQFKTIYELGRYIEIQTQGAPSAVDSSEFELIDI